MIDFIFELDSDQEDDVSSSEDEEKETDPKVKEAAN